MKKILCSSILLATMSTFAGTITAVDLGKAVNGSAEIVFKNAGIMPTAFNTNSPASIVLDFSNTTSGLTTRETAVNKNGIYTIDVIPGEKRTRAVLNLANPTAYDIKLVGQDVHVVLDASSASSAFEPKLNSTMFTPVTKGLNEDSVPVKLDVSEPSNNVNMANNKVPNLPDLKPMFHKNVDKGGVLSFTLPSRDSVVDVSTEGASVVATIKNYKVPRSGQKRLDVADYGSPARSVDILPSGADTRVVVNMGRNAYEYVTYQKGNIYSIEVKQPSVDEESKRLRELAGFGSGKQYVGQPLSLNFQDIEVRAVLQIIAEFTNNNIVVSDSVVGNITLRLDNVPWDQALDIIMKTKGLAMRKVDHVIYIAPEVELNNMEIEALIALQKKQSLQPTRSETIRLKYASAISIVEAIEDATSKLSNGGKDGAVIEDAFLSAKGSIFADERTNTLIVNDIPSKIKRIRALVEDIDEPVRQVLIDSRLVITTDTYSRDLGAKFGISFLGGPNADMKRLSDGTNIVGSGSIFSKSDLNNRELSNRLGVNLGIGSSTPASYGISILGKDVIVDLELQALQSEGRSEIISSPRVVTQDGNKALVASGQEIPYTTITEDGVEISFKDAKLSLEVTPHIAPNDRVSMDLDITKDEPDYSNLVHGEPPLKTNEISTKVEVQSGETIVLGGIYQQKQSTAVNKVPVLGDIPLVGNAFKNTNKVFDKDELLVFITPKILNEQLADYDKFSNLRD